MDVLAQRITAILAHPALTWTGVALVLVAWFSIGAYGSALFDWDEALYAETSRNMVETGDVMTPIFNGELRAKKPIAIYWHMATAYALVGVSEYAARLISILSVAATAVFIGLFTTRLAGGRRRAGLIAAAAFALNPMLLAQARLATIDATLMLACTIATLQLYELLARRGQPWRWIIVGIAVAWGLLLKGPVALLFTAFPAIVLLVFVREPGRMEHLRSKPQVRARLIGLGVCTVITVPWYLAIGATTDWQYYVVALINEILKRAAEPQEGHSGPFWFYLPVVAMGFFPWVTMLLMAWGAFRRAIDRKLATFLAVFIVAPVVPLSFMSTKMLHYILPIWPLLGACAGLALDRALANAATMGVRCKENGRSRRGPADYLALALFGLPALGIAIGGLIGPPIYGTTLSDRFGAPAAMDAMLALWPFTAVASVVMGVTGVFAVIALWRTQMNRAIAYTGAGLGMTAFVLALGMPTFTAHFASPQVAPLVAEVATADERVATWGFSSPSLAYYSGHNTEELQGGPKGILERLKSDEAPHVLVASERRRIENTATEGPRAPTYINEKDAAIRSELARIVDEDYALVSSTQGYQIEFGRWVTLEVFVRK